MKTRTSFTALFLCIVCMSIMSCSFFKSLKKGGRQSAEMLPPPPLPPPPAPAQPYPIILDTLTSAGEMAGIGYEELLVGAAAPLPVREVSASGSVFPRASIAYSYKNEVKKGESTIINVRVALNKPLMEIERNLRDRLNENRAVGKETSDTSIVKSLEVVGDRYFKIIIEADPAFFRIEGSDTGFQELDVARGNSWLWRVYGLQDTKGSEIVLRILSKDDQGVVRKVDEVFLNMAVTAGEATVMQKESSISSSFRAKDVLPATNNYWWWILGLVPLIILAFWWWKRKKAAAPGKRIFFSYAWGGEREVFIDHLYKSLSNDGLNVVRDKIDLQYKGKISSFMTEIGKGNFVIVVISDKYLRSRFCMFELYEIFRNSRMDKDEFIRKIFPIRIEEIDLGNPAVVKSYVEFWEAEDVKWEDRIKAESDTMTTEQFNQYKVVKNIASDIADLLCCMADINSLTMDQLTTNDFSELKKALRAAEENI